LYHKKKLKKKLKKLKKKLKKLKMKLKKMKMKRIRRVPPPHHHRHRHPQHHHRRHLLPTCSLNSTFATRTLMGRFAIYLCPVRTLVFSSFYSYAAGRPSQVVVRKLKPNTHRLFPPRSLMQCRKCGRNFTKSVSWKPRNSDWS